MNLTRTSDKPVDVAERRAASRSDDRVDVERAGVRS
jgi:hypothetical protein